MKRKILVFAIITLMGEIGWYRLVRKSSLYVRFFGTNFDFGSVKIHDLHVLRISFCTIGWYS